MPNSLLKSRSFSKQLLPLGLVGAFIIIIVAIMQSKPTAERRPSDAQAQITVKVNTLTPETYPIIIKSYGLVAPVTQTSIISRVSGVVDFVDDDFREGGNFKEGQLLVSLEKDDYLIELDIAKAQVAEAQSRWQTEKALAVEAEYDWKRSGRQGEAPALALREPQLKAAEAVLKSAEAAVKRAELNLQRTDIRAPFDGQVLSHNISLAQVVGVNSVLGEVFATQAAEVKLPIKSQDYQYLDLPLKDGEAPKVTFTTQLGKPQTWQGKLVRASGAIDEMSRQLYVVARIEKPFVIGDADSRPLKVGEYLTAQIHGIRLQDALVIPNSAIYQGSYVYLYDEGKVQRKEIAIGWSNDNDALISEGLQEDDKLVITPLGRVTSGTLVKVTGENASDVADKKKPTEAVDKQQPPSKSASYEAAR